MVRDGFGKRLRYRIDNALARGVTVVLLWVGLILLALVVLISIVMWAGGFGPQDEAYPFLENLWQAMTRSLDPGTFGGDEGIRFRAAGLVVTLGGLIAVSLVIGLISNAVDTRLDLLRRGRSIVVEQNHTLVLGYSSKLPLVVRELMEAAESDDNRSIVVLTPEDKIELEESLRRQLPVRYKTRLVVRRGEPASLHDLAQVRPETAAAAIVLRPDESSGDAEVVRVSIALRQARRTLPPIPIVAELEDAAIARSLRQAVPESVLTVVSLDVVARIAAQTARASGLGSVFQELLDFSGDEFYTTAVPGHLIGRPFSDALFASESCTSVGLIRREETLLAPDPELIIEPHDSLILIAADDSAVSFSSVAKPAPMFAGRPRPVREATSTKTLVVGWNKFAARILDELIQNSSQDTSIHVLIDPEVSEGFDREALESLGAKNVDYAYGSTIDPLVLTAALEHGPFEHILVLCSHQQLQPLESDARALLALMHLRDHLDSLPQADRNEINLVSEVLEPESAEIAQVARPDDFIVSQRLVSLYLAQLVEDPERQGIIDALLSASGPEINIEPCLNYLSVGEHTFAELVASAAAQGKVAIGWRNLTGTRDSRELAGGVRINPAKQETVMVQESTKAILLSRRSA